MNGPNWPIVDYQNWHDLKNEVICDPCLLEGITCANDRVTELYIDGGEATIAGSLPSAISGLTELEVLEISGSDMSGKFLLQLARY